jgi:hypothetical protein
MGTRSLTYVYDDETTPVVCMYRQFDGYMSGHGSALNDFLSSFAAIVNGISITEERKVANGMGCLAAQLVAHFKVGAGGFYLHPTELNQDCGQEYEYHIFEDKIVVKDPCDIIFEGSWEDFQEHIINVKETA